MKRNYHTNLAFLDLLFNTLLAFAAFFVLAIVLINPTKQENNTETKAEFMVVVEWPSDLDDDVDTYVEDPSGNLVAFMRREEGLMHLDRDDLGHRNDSVLTEFGVIEYTENRELVTLRGIAKGEYIVNVHLYMKRSTATEIPVVIKLEKLNPYKTVTIKRVVLRVTGDEETAFRFTLDNEGKVVDVNELPKKLAVKGQQTPL
tara:strand:- start:1496 stop:2101 length:606 start_codon:yes stop_codon:yes gene_type:complete